MTATGAPVAYAPSGPGLFVAYLRDLPGLLFESLPRWGFRDGRETVIGHKLTVRRDNGVAYPAVLTVEYRYCTDGEIRVMLPDWIAEDDHPDAQLLFRAGHELAWWAEIQQGGPLASLPMDDPDEDEGAWQR